MKNNFPGLRIKLTIMRNLFILMFLLVATTLQATTYYVSSSNGNDANSGTSPSSAWQTLSQVNSFSSFAPGDVVLFNRGDVFYGQLVITNSGSSGNPITYGAYGAGVNPKISGFTNITSWTNLGGNIWESTNGISTGSAINMVNVNGANTPMGRFPNTGWLTYESFSGTNSITSSSLSGSPNWTGADAVIRKQRFIIDRNQITSQSGGTITYISDPKYSGNKNYGFFIQNDPRTLDVQNEWYYNPATKKIRIYSVGMPTNVQVATVDTLVSMKFNNYITFDNLAFEGSNKDAFVILSSSNVTIQNCSIDYSGTDAIWGNQNWGASSGSFALKNSSINHTNNNAINLAEEFSGALISHNVIKNTGMLVGMGGNGDGTCVAVQTAANNAIIEYNEIDSTGYIGITFKDNNVIARNNFLNGFCLRKLDGAGIYTWNGAGNAAFTGQKIINNIVINGLGDNGGTSATGNPIAHGIYLDWGTANMEVAGNSIANCSHSGLYIHDAFNLNVHDNTSFNNGQFQALLASFDAGVPIRNDIIKNNIFVSKTLSQTVASFETASNDISSFGNLNYNYWARPINDSATISYFIYNYTKGGKLNLTQWQAFSGMDLNSKKSPKAITNVNDLRFEYNATSSNKTISLDGTYIDAKNISYNGAITLAPYTSAVLIRNGAATNQPPTANAGADQTITLPASTVTLSGSGTDVGGSISGYSWTKISGPSQGTIANGSSNATTVTGLVQGVYQFQLKVTDNSGMSDLDTVQITVNSASVNLLPSVNPANTVNGLDYKYYEGSYTSVPDFSTLTPVKVDSISNFDISVANRSDQFLFNFTGYINIPSDGQYTFYTTSDDGSTLYIDNVLVVNNDGLHGATEQSGVIGLKAGKHFISVEYFEQTGSQVLSVSYAGAGISKQLIPSSSLYRVSVGNLLPAVNPSNTQSGLNYNYYEAPDYVQLPNFSTLTPVKTGSTPDFDISLANRNTEFSFNYTGYIQVPTDGQYTFYTNSDDGSNLYIDGVLVVNNDNVQGATEVSGIIGLKAGKHTISVGYFQRYGGSSLSVSYAGPGISKQVIPASTLFSDVLLPALNPANTTSGLNYNYYEASDYVQLPDFSTIIPVKTGTCTNFDISLANRNTEFSFNYTGYIDIPADGQYTFYTNSDDGSNLYIDGVLVINNDNVHGPAEVSGVIGLRAGKHAISVGYFQRYGWTALTVSYAGPGISKQFIPASSLSKGALAGTSTLAVDNTINQAITNTNQIGVKAFPNPFINSITVSINGDAGKYKLMLVDVLGKIIWAQDGVKANGYFEQSISTSALQKGIYFLRFIQNNKSSVVKLEK